MTVRLIDVIRLGRHPTPMARFAQAEPETGTGGGRERPTINEMHCHRSFGIAAKSSINLSSRLREKVLYGTGYRKAQSPCLISLPTQLARFDFL